MAKAKVSVAQMAAALSNYKFDTSNYVSLTPISKLKSVTKLSGSVLTQPKPKPKK